MDPLSAEAQAILRHYKVTYDEAIFYQSHHQTGKYVSAWFALADETRESACTNAPASFPYIVASRWYNSDAMGSYHDIVGLAEEQLPLE